VTEAPNECRLFVLLFCKLGVEEHSHRRITTNDFGKEVLSVSQCEGIVRAFLQVGYFRVVVPTAPASLTDLLRVIVSHISTLPNPPSSDGQIGDNLTWAVEATMEM
jgi:hypothetical protein